MNGTTPDPEKAQRKTLQEFRKNMQDVLKPEHDDAYLLKWLKAKDFNLQKAEKLLRFNFRVRSSYQLDKLPYIYKVAEIFQKFSFYGFLGYDKEGSPVRYICFGRGDCEGFTKCISLFDVCIYGSYVLESDLVALKEENKKTGRHADGHLCIIDFEGFEIQQYLQKHMIEMGFDLLRIFQDLYPDVVKRVIFINAPMVFYTLYNIFKPCVRLNLLEKIDVYGRGGAFRQELLKRVDADLLPVFLGGTRVDCNGDPRCSAFITYGGKVPSSYFAKNHPQIELGDPGVQKAVIPARGNFRYVFTVNEAGSKMSIEFRSDLSVFLKILYKPFEKDIPKNDSTENRKAELISPPARIHSHIAPVKCQLYCDSPGKYILLFDNSYSWINSKQLIYRFKVIPPDT